MRPRHESIGALGRTPARSGRVPVTTTPLPPVTPPPPEPGAVRRWVHGALFDNVGLKFLSMVLAVTVFLLVNTDKDREITARIGVAYTLPDDRVLVSDRVDEIRVTIKGSWRRLRKFDEREVDRINLDLRRASSGEIPITPDMVHLPAGLAVTSVSPRTVRIVFEKRIEKLVEVTPSITGRAQHGYVVAEIKPVPATVKVRGAESVLAALSALRTREISLEGRTDSFVAETEVVMPDSVELVGSQQIAMQVRIDEELVSRKHPGLAVGLKGDADPARWTITPPTVDVTLTGALLSVEKAKTAMKPVVKVPTGGGDKAREVEVTIDGLPPGVGVKISPERVNVAPAKAPPAPPPTP